MMTRPRDRENSTPYLLKMILMRASERRKEANAKCFSNKNTAKSSNNTKKKVGQQIQQPR
jgi:hypothetical protein